MAKVKLNENRDEIMAQLGLSSRGRPPYIPQNHNECRSATAMANQLKKLIESPATTPGEAKSLERFIAIKERGVELYNQLKDMGYSPADIRRFDHGDSGDN